MTDLQLRLFVELSRCLSFSKTADKFYTTQPTVSRQIKMLEDEWDIRLFDRNKRQVKLTKGGKVLADFFSNQDHTFEIILRKAKKYNEKEKK